MKRIFILWTLCVMGFTTIAQETRNGKISITIQNHLQQPLENATAELLRSKDSSLVKISLTDKNGLAEFENLKQGSYLVRTTAVGYGKSFSATVTISAEQSSVQIPALAMQLANSSNLQEVVVKKPFIQKLTDRIVVNVENSVVNAGSSAFDVLERSPGVQIDPNDNISMRGRAGVIIMIDGKPTPMTGGDLVNYLRGLPSNAIERIDLITNPSAKYDAAGNSGIIDIRMKKDRRYGMNGTFTGVMDKVFIQKPMPVLLLTTAIKR